MIHRAEDTELLDVGGTPVHAVRWQPRQNGQAALTANVPVLLLHGLGGSTLNWNLVAPRFAEVLHTQVTAILIIASVGCSIFGSGRSSKRISRGP